MLNRSRNASLELLNALLTDPELPKSALSCLHRHLTHLRSNASNARREQGFEFLLNIIQSLGCASSAAHCNCALDRRHNQHSQTPGLGGAQAFPAQGAG